MNLKKITSLVLGRIAQYAQDNAPKGKENGSRKAGQVKLENSIGYKVIGPTEGVVFANTPYAAAIEYGRKKTDIVPNLTKNPPLGNRVIKGSKEGYRKKARLKFKIGGKYEYARKVVQLAREAQPFIQPAIDKVISEKFSFLKTPLKNEIEEDVFKNLVNDIKIDVKI